MLGIIKIMFYILLILILGILIFVCLSVIIEPIKNYYKKKGGKNE